MDPFFRSHCTFTFIFIWMFFILHTLHAEVSLYAVTDQLTKVQRTCTVQNLCGEHSKCVCVYTVCMYCMYYIYNFFSFFSFFLVSKTKSHQEDTAMNAVQFQLQWRAFWITETHCPTNWSDLICFVQPLSVCKGNMHTDQILFFFMLY